MPDIQVLPESDSLSCWRNVAKRKLSIRSDDRHLTHIVDDLRLHMPTYKLEEHYGAETDLGHGFCESLTMTKSSARVHKFKCRIAGNPTYKWSLPGKAELRRRSRVDPHLNKMA